jgi:hypothetical protein
LRPDHETRVEFSGLDTGSWYETDERGGGCDSRSRLQECSAAITGSAHIYSFGFTAAGFFAVAYSIAAYANVWKSVNIFGNLAMPD